MFLSITVKNKKASRSSRDLQIDYCVQYCIRKNYNFLRLRDK